MTSRIVVQIAALIVAGLSSATWCGSLAIAAQPPSRARDDAAAPAQTLAGVAEYAVVAQASPSWGSTNNRGSSLPQSPNAVNRVAAAPNAAVNANQAPKDRDCKTLVTKSEQNYVSNFTKWHTDGTEDHGQILNGVAVVGQAVQVDLEDVQVRIEQLRCEDQNIKAKLDYLIRRLP